MMLIITVTAIIFNRGTDAKLELAYNTAALLFNFEYLLLASLKCSTML